MSHWYTPAKAKVMSGDIDLNTHDIRALMVMSNSTADTETDAEFIGSFTTLDECDGANYARVTLTGEAVAADLANDRGEFDANDISWTNLGAGTRDNIGIVLFRFVTNDADSPVIAYVNSGGFPFNGSGINVSVAWNAEGILQLT